MSRIASFVNLIGQSKISILGAALVTSAVLGDLILIIGEILFFQSNPYIGIIIYAVFPAIGIGGLVLIPIGTLWTARRRGASSLKDSFSALKVTNFRHVFQVVFLLTMVNLVVFGSVGYRSFHFMESREFCGTMCHQPMHAEFNTYQNSPHSEIGCVECHIGSGVGWLIKSKLDGTRQLIAMLLDDYSRPIATPLHNLRPARDVCEVCHHPESFHGNLIKVIQDFEPDEKNTRHYTVLNMRVGGGEAPGRKARGIHWHVSREQRLRYYAADEKREEILRVEQLSDDGITRVWTRSGVKIPPEASDPANMRNMDCVDCHNRPTHIYLPPGRALDEKLEFGEIDRSIPWIRKLSEEIITREYASHDDATLKISELTTIYRERYPEHWEEFGARVEAAVPVLQKIYNLYVHPEMNIKWNTYPSLIGHPTPATQACFRCHDGLLRDEQGKTISADCDSCHYILADRERDPMVLRALEDR